MNACTLRLREDEHGKPYLSGTMNFDLERGAIVILRKVTETEYQLRALTGDGRKVNNSQETLSSFIEFDRDIPPLPEPDLSEVEYVEPAEAGKRGDG